MDPLSVAEVANRLGISVRRVQQLIKSGRLPAKQFGGSYMIQEDDISLVYDRKPGRPPNKSRQPSQRSKKK